MIIKTSIKEQAHSNGEGIRFAVYHGKGPAGTKKAVEQNISKL